MKNKKILIILSVVAIIFIFFACYLLLNKEDKKTIKEEIHYKTQEVEKIIKEKQNKIVYIYNTDSKECPLCQDSMNYFKYFKETYKLDLMEIDYKEVKQEERKELEEILMLDNHASKRLNIIHIKNGEIVGQNIGEISKDSMLEDLHNNGYISDEAYNDEKESGNTDIYELKKKTIVLLTSNLAENTNDLRTTIKNIAKKNKVGFRYIETDLAINGKVRRQIREDIGEYAIPSVIIIENKEIKEYTADLSEENLKSLLNK